MGFRFDYLNKNSIVVLGTPTDLEMEKLESIIEELVEQFKNKSSIEKHDNLSRSLAKTMSIKSGRKLNLRKCVLSLIIYLLVKYPIPQLKENQRLLP